MIKLDLNLLCIIDLSDTYYIKNYNNYINEFEKEWQNYKDSLKKVISEKEEEMKE